MSGVLVMRKMDADLVEQIREECKKLFQMWEDLGFSDSQLAYLWEVSIMTIQRWKNGKSIPDRDTVSGRKIHLHLQNRCGTMYWKSKKPTKGNGNGL